MSLRSFLGLCDHRWKAIGLLENSVGMAQGYGAKIVTGYTEIRECEKCGTAKSFKL